MLFFTDIHFQSQNCACAIVQYLQARL